MSVSFGCEKKNESLVSASALKFVHTFFLQDLSLVGPNYENLFKTAGPTMFSAKDYRMGTGIGESTLLGISTLSLYPKTGRLSLASKRASLKFV